MNPIPYCIIIINELTVMIHYDINRKGGISMAQVYDAADLFIERSYDCA